MQPLSRVHWALSQACGSAALSLLCGTHHPNVAVIPLSAAQRETAAQKRLEKSQEKLGIELAGSREAEEADGRAACAGATKEACCSRSPTATLKTPRPLLLPRWRKSREVT